jgi:two-component system, LuxR family, secretion system response regulator SsrB
MMPPEALEGYAHRIEVLRERNRDIRQALDHEFKRLMILRRRTVKDTPVPSDSPALQDLTPRELEVLRCIAEGCSTKETAKRLSISFKTAACHRHHIMQKLGLHGTGSLVRFAIVNRVVSLPGRL